MADKRKEEEGREKDDALKPLATQKRKLPKFLESFKQFEDLPLTDKLKACIEKRFQFKDMTAPQRITIPLMLKGVLPPQSFFCVCVCVNVCPSLLSFFSLPLFYPPPSLLSLLLPLSPLSPSLSFSLTHPFHPLPVSPFAGEDVMVRSATGSGKTLAYAIPIIHDLQSLKHQVCSSPGPNASIVSFHPLSLLPPFVLSFQVIPLLAIDVRHSSGFCAAALSLSNPPSFFFFFFFFWLGLC